MLNRIICIRSLKVIIKEALFSLLWDADFTSVGVHLPVVSMFDWISRVTGSVSNIQHSITISWKKVIAQKIIISTNGHAYTKIVMPYIKIKKLIISMKKIHTEVRPGNGAGYYLLLWKAIYNLNSLETEPAVTVNSDHGDRILSDVCCILNCNL